MKTSIFFVFSDVFLNLFSQNISCVMILYLKYLLEGTPPECFHEYLDLFTELRKPEDKSLIETPFGGRYCGKIPPRLRISLYNGLSFVFHTDRENITEQRFSGNFQFVTEGKREFITYFHIDNFNVLKRGKAKLLIVVLIDLVLKYSYSSDFMKFLFSNNNTICSLFLCIQKFRQTTQLGI